MEEDESKELEELKESINYIGDKMQPYSKIILMICIVLFVFLILFMGFAGGAYKVCKQIDGFLDDSFYCHEDYYNKSNELKIVFDFNDNST